MKQVIQSQVSTERARGRPLDGGQHDLKIEILDTAEQLFTDHGYAATSIRQIAEIVGVNPALVHYYFSSKHALLEIVMERALQPLIEALASLKDRPQASVQDIACLLVSTAVEQPNIPLLLTREVLLPGGEMQDYFAENLAPRLGGALPALLKREKAANRLKDGFDPSYSSLLVLAVSFFPFIARSLAEPVLGIKFDKQGTDILTKHVATLLEQGMTS